MLRTPSASPVLGIAKYRLEEIADSSSLQFATSTGSRDRDGVAVGLPRPGQASFSCYPAVSWVLLLGLSGMTPCKAVESLCCIAFLL